MIGGAHLSAECGEGQRQQAGRAPPACGQLGRPGGRVAEAQRGRGGMAGWGKKNGGGLQLGQKPKLGPIQVINLFDLFLKFEFFWQLWKFVHGDLEGILAWEFFLNSSRLLKDFRKVYYAMPCNASYKRFIFGRFFICTAN
jgi:hypothetical protein